jgi:hypothetical protein
VIQPVRRQHPNVVYRSWAKERNEVLALLGQRERWHVHELATALNLAHREIQTVLQQLRRNKQVKSKGFGIVVAA